MKLSGVCNVTGKHPLVGGFNIFVVVKKTLFGIRVPADILKGVETTNQWLNSYTKPCFCLPPNVEYHPTNNQNLYKGGKPSWYARRICWTFGDINVYLLSFVLFFVLGFYTSRSCHRRWLQCTEWPGRCHMCNTKNVSMCSWKWGVSFTLR